VAYLTNEITQRAARFIDRHAAEPFFVEVAYNAVHWPFQPPDLAASDPKRTRRKAPMRQMPDDASPATRRDYVRMLERADEGIGTILAALDRNGVAQNTLVIFTNDNGGEWLSRNAPLYHRKATLWEGGIRVPLILRWLGRLPKGKTSGQVAITADLTASILAATGTALPTGYRPDHRFLPTLAPGRRHEYHRHPCAGQPLSSLLTSCVSRRWCSARVRIWHASTLHAAPAPRRTPHVE